MAPRDRKARLEDVEAIAMALPEVATRATFGDLPAYAVRGRNFVSFREPRRDAVDPDTGELMTDVVIVWVPDESAKEALVQSAGPWFTTAHFTGYPAVLVRQRDLGALTLSELREVITDAWAARAPKRLVSEYFTSQG